MRLKPRMIAVGAVARGLGRADLRQADRDGDSELNSYNEQLARPARHDAR